jgi:glutathione S-transferase
MHKLYFGPGACSFVPHAALEVIKTRTGEDFDTQLVKLHKNEQGTPEFLALIRTAWCRCCWWTARR